MDDKIKQTLMSLSGLLFLYIIFGSFDLFGTNYKQPVCEYAPNSGRFCGIEDARAFRNLGKTDSIYVFNVATWDINKEPESISFKDMFKDAFENLINEGESGVDFGNYNSSSYGTTETGYYREIEHQNKKIHMLLLGNGYGQILFMQKGDEKATAYPKIMEKDITVKLERIFDDPLEMVKTGRGNEELINVNLLMKRYKPSVHGISFIDDIRPNNQQRVLTGEYNGQTFTKRVKYATHFAGKDDYVGIRMVDYLHEAK